MWYHVRSFVSYCKYICAWRHLQFYHWYKDSRTLSPFIKSRWERFSSLLWLIHLVTASTKAPRESYCGCLFPWRIQTGFSVLPLNVDIVPVSRTLTLPAQCHLTTITVCIKAEELSYSVSLFNHSLVDLDTSLPMNLCGLSHSDALIFDWEEGVSAGGWSPLRAILADQYPRLITGLRRHSCHPDRRHSLSCRSI